MYQCRYIGQEIGWIGFSLKDGAGTELFLKALIQTCRGIFKDTTNDMPATPCLVYYPLWWNYTIQSKVFTHAQLHTNANDRSFLPLASLVSSTSYARHLWKLFDKVYHITTGKGSAVLWQWCYSLGLSKDINQQGSKFDTYWVTQLGEIIDQQEYQRNQIWKEHMKNIVK